jgi:hypothetical protein
LGVRRSSPGSAAVPARIARRLVIGMVYRRAAGSGSRSRRGRDYLISAAAGSRWLDEPATALGNERLATRSRRPTSLDCRWQITLRLRSNWYVGGCLSQVDSTCRGWRQSSSVRGLFSSGDPEGVRELSPGQRGASPRVQREPMVAGRRSAGDLAAKLASLPAGFQPAWVGAGNPGATLRFAPG